MEHGGVLYIYTVCKHIYATYVKVIFPNRKLDSGRYNSSVADPVPFLPDPVLEKSDPDPGDQKIPDPDPTYICLF